MLGIYKIADTVISVDSVFEDVHKLCSDYVSSGEPELFIKTDAGNIAFERKKSAEENIYEGIPVIEYPDGYLETLAVYRKLATALLEKDILLFHGSAIAVDGEVYLFTAKSGTGKSTHTRLWRNKFGERAVMVNDDKPLIKITQAGMEVFGTPWDGKHRLSKNMSAPLKAICILTRAAENDIRKADPGEVFPMIFQQAYRPKDPAGLKKALELAIKLSNSCPLYVLGCNMDPSAADVAYEGMQE